MSEKKVGKRLLTWVLVLVMTLSLLPLNVLADEAAVENTSPNDAFEVYDSRDYGGNRGYESNEGKIDWKQFAGYSGKSMIRHTPTTTECTVLVGTEEWVSGAKIDISKIRASGITIRPKAGYYVKQVVIACNDDGGYNCQTAKRDGIVKFGNTTTESADFKIDSSNLGSNAAVNGNKVWHTGMGYPMHLMIWLAESPNPVHVTYNAGTMASVISSALVDYATETQPDSVVMDAEFPKLSDDGNTITYQYDRAQSTALPEHTILDIKDAYKSVIGADGKLYQFDGWKIESQVDNAGSNDWHSVSGDSTPGNKLNLYANYRLTAQWKAVDGAQVDLSNYIQKSLTTDGSTLPTGGVEFTVNVTDEAGAKVATGTVKMISGGTADFRFSGNNVVNNKLTFTQPGIYAYTVQEVEGTVDGVTYDKNTYSLTITVTADEGNGTYTKDVAVSGDTLATGAKCITINNEYKAPHTPTAILSVEKAVAGITDANGNIKAIERDTDGKITTVAYPTDVIEWTITVTNSGDAAGTFTLKESLSNITVKDAEGNDVTLTNGAWSGTVAASQSVSYTVTYVVTESDAENTTLINTVKLDNNEPTPAPEVPTAKKYTVSYVLGDGSWKSGEAVTDAKYPAGTEVTVTDKIPVKNGYTFTGWEVTEPKTGTPEINTDANDKKTFTMPAADVTLTAQWEKNKAPILSVKKEVTKVGNTDIATGVTIPPAYPGDEIVWTITVTNIGDAAGTFTLKESLSNITVKDAEGNDVTPTDGAWSGTVAASQSVSYTVTYVVTESDAEATTLINTVKLDNNEPTPAPEVPTAKKYTVSYVLGDGSWKSGEAVTDAKYPASAEVTVTSNIPEKKGYTFAGWTVTTDSVSVAAPEISNSKFTMPAANVTLTAKWTVTPITVDLNKLGGEGNAAVYKNLTISAGSDSLPSSFSTTFVATIKPDADGTMTFDSYTGTATVTKNNHTKVPFVFERPSINASIEEDSVPYGKLLFAKEGVYTYSVKETIPADKDKVSGVTYDKTQYTLTIKVVEGDDGLYVDNYYVGKEGNKVPVTITNTYYKHTYHPRPNPTPTIVIPDDDALGLNTTDHFAYIVGYGNGEVRPQNNITRAEVATIFFRLLTDDVRDENLTKTNPYSDVAATAWYNTAVSTLSSMGIITGYPDGTFRPNAAITRAEFAAIAARFDNDGDKTTASFSDIASHWAKDEISIAYNNGWINGYPDGTFGPQRDITRAETMTLVNRVLNRLPETEEDLLPNMTVWTDNANPNAWYYLAVQEATNSHYYEFKTNSQYEKWTELRETRDWTLLEK